MHRVVKDFRDKTNQKIYKKGDSYEHEDAERIAFLIGEGFIVTEKKVKKFFKK